MSSAYPDFRRRLDAVLSRRDPDALRAFLIAEGQWDASTSTDPARAMWMMIATSPALHTLHGEAIRWLEDHGFATEAHALGHRAQPSSARGQQRPATRGPMRSHDRRSPPATHLPRKPKLGT